MRNFVCDPSLHSSLPSLPSSLSYPATTERDGNEVIAATKTVCKKAYLMYLAKNIHRDDDEAGVTDDDYYDDYEDACPVYSKTGDRD